MAFAVFSRSRKVKANCGRCQSYFLLLNYFLLWQDIVHCKPKRLNPQEGGPKGIDIDKDMTVLAATCEFQTLAFFDLARTDGVMPIVRETARFNQHRGLILALLRHPPVRRVFFGRLRGHTPSPIDVPQLG